MLSFLDDLSQSPDSGYFISEIWALEPVHHGDAAVLNKDADLIGRFSFKLPPTLS